MGELRQLAEDHRGGLVAIVVRQGPDAGRNSDAPGSLHVDRPYAGGSLVLTKRTIVLFSPM
jgi:hypothetical protein